jgi:hypothetical protein
LDGGESLNAELKTDLKKGLIVKGIAEEIYTSGNSCRGRNIYKRGEVVGRKE